MMDNEVERMIMPSAWMHDDGRVVPAATKAGAEADGGAMRSSLSGHTIALVTMAQAERMVAAERERIAARLCGMDCAHGCGIGAELAAAIRAQQPEKDG